VPEILTITPWPDPVLDTSWAGMSLAAGRSRLRNATASRGGYTFFSVMGTGWFSTGSMLVYVTVPGPHV
jgi:hypothetical protein